MARPTLQNASYWHKSDVELLFIIDDASATARCMRGFDPRAEAKYLDQVNDACTVLAWIRRN
jgi:hypothetical protein